MPRDDHGVADTAAYSRAALASECAAIRNASIGRQEKTLNDGALKMGGLIRDGLLDHAEAKSALVSAGLSMPSQSGREPWTRRDVEAKVDRALRDGLKNPRGAPRRTRERQQPIRPAKANGKANGEAHPEPKRRVVERYDYTDEAGKLLFQTLRYEPKRFSQGHRDEAGRWVGNIEGVRRVLYRLPELVAAPSDATVFIAEGEKDADNLRELGLVATTNPMGAEKWRAEYGQHLEGRDVVILSDADEKGRKHAKDVAAKLDGYARRIRTLELPSPHKDVSDWIAAGGTAAELLALVEAAPDAEDAEAAADNRPTIRVAPGEIPRIVDEAEAALIAADLGFYTRGAFLVRPATVRIAVADDRKVEGQRLVPAGEAVLLEAMASAARWERYDGRSKRRVPTDPPPMAARVLRERVGRWKLPFVAGLVNAPTLRPDGSLLSAPGYDAATGLLLDTRGAVFPNIPEHPTRDDALRALATLKDLIRDFSFVGEADRAVALSGIFTACVRRALRTAPLHGFTAPVAGSGKSLLADIASTIACGREASVIAQGKSEEELEKRLGAQLLAGDAMVSIDNCENPLGGEFLCQALTQPFVRVRILGRSEAPELPADSFITATGNNLTLSGDLTRRALLCRLDPKMERPELREFDQHPIARVKAKRGHYVAAVLTALRAHHVAGQPSRHPPIGSFESWSRWVRDALVWLGEADPTQTMEHARASDPRLTTLRAVIEQWRQHFGVERVTVRSLIDCAARMRTTTAADTGPPGRHEFANPDFREALLAVAGAGGAISGRNLGYWLRSNRDRVVDGHRIVQDSVLHGTATWRLVRA